MHIYLDLRCRFGTKPALADIEFLARSQHRVRVLDALADWPRDRVDLRDATGASSPTIGRILGDFEARKWTVRNGDTYELTPLGAFVAEKFLALLDQMETERKFRDVSQWLPTEVNGFAVEIISDAVTTVAKPGDPYAPVHRCASLFRNANRFSGFDAAPTEPPYVEELYTQVANGLETEIILPPEVVARIGAAHPERSSEVLESGNLSLWLHDDLPLYRLTIFDDRIGIGGYDPHTGLLQVYVDTAASEAIEWAESTYESYRSDSRLLAPDEPAP